LRYGGARSEIGRSAGLGKGGPKFSIVEAITPTTQTNPIPGVESTYS
jgi:hypothetical protein